MGLFVTGAVGDVDGDGDLDLITLDVLSGDMISDTYSYNSTVSDIVLSRSSLSQALKGYPRILPLKQQPWRMYMGSSGDNGYTHLAR